MLLSPAFWITAVARYGFAEGSVDLTSSRVAALRFDGILSNGVPLLPLDEISGAASTTELRRVHEFTSGMQTAVYPLASSNKTAIKYIISPGSPSSPRSS